MYLKNIITNNDISILLQGRPGLPMVEDALDYVSTIFGTTEYENHPDYLFVDIPAGKASIGVDDVMPIIQKSYVKPILLDKAVVVVNHMDSMTEAAQNKLLLSLEESPYLFLIGISYSERIITTVKSRMKVVSYNVSGKKDFISECQNIYGCSDGLLLYHACGGCSGMIPQFIDELPMFKELHMACMGNNRSSIYDILHLVKEKDKLAVTENRDLLLAVIKLMQYSFLERACTVLNTDAFAAQRCIDIVDKLTDEERLCSQSGYSKNNFFRTMCFCVEH